MRAPHLREIYKYIDKKLSMCDSRLCRLHYILYTTGMQSAYNSVHGVYAGYKPITSHSHFNSVFYASLVQNPIFVWICSNSSLSPVEVLPVILYSPTFWLNISAQQIKSENSQFSLGIVSQVLAKCIHRIGSQG